MYMDESTGLFQEFICQLWKSYDSFRNEFRLDVSRWLLIQLSFSKERKERSINESYLKISKKNGFRNVESQIEHFIKAVLRKKW
jgi:RNA polymerase sigma-70 factor (ECF subfamily)